jgi:hypothetical protein
MTVIARFDPAGVAVEPGQQATIELVVHNASNQVEAYHLAPVGEPAAWAVVDPPQLSVYPGDEDRARVTFAPPRTATMTTGQQPFGVQVTPSEHPEDTTVPEAIVELLPFSDVGIELTPRTAQGRGRTRHELAIDNRGNAEVPLALAGTDPDEAVAVRVAPAHIVVPAGVAAFAKVQVSPTRRRWTGQPATHPFQVTATPEDGPPLAVDGTMVEQPVLPSWLGRAAAVAAALAVLALIGWFALLRPAVRSAAEDAAAKEAAKTVAAPMAKVQADSAKANDTAAAAQEAAAASAAGTNAMGKKLEEKGVLKPGEVPPVVLPPPAPGQPSPTPLPTTSPVVAPQAVAGPLSQRLPLSTPKGTTKATNFPVGAKQELSLTDVFYENPQGDTGTLTVKAGTKVLFTKGLANFRDLADHFVSPIVLAPGTNLTLQVTCVQPGKTAAANQCSDALVLVGTVAPAPAR